MNKNILIVIIAAAAVFLAHRITYSVAWWSGFKSGTAASLSILGDEDLETVTKRVIDGRLYK